MSNRKQGRLALDYCIGAAPRTERNMAQAELDTLRRELAAAREALAEYTGIVVSEGDDPVCEVDGCGRPCEWHNGYALEMCAYHERQSQ